MVRLSKFASRRTRIGNTAKNEVAFCQEIYFVAFALPYVRPQCGSTWKGHFSRYSRTDGRLWEKKCHEIRTKTELQSRALSIFPLEYFLYRYLLLETSQNKTSIYFFIHKEKLIVSRKKNCPRRQRCRSEFAMPFKIRISAAESSLISSFLCGEAKSMHINADFIGAVSFIFKFVQVALGKA